jgi:PKD repeat protein
MKKSILLISILVFGYFTKQSKAQPYVFEDFVGTWYGTISSQTYPPYSDPMTMIIYDDHFYTETSGHLMPTIYPNTQECDYEASTNRFHWWYLQTVYAGQYFYQHFYYEVVYFSNDTLEMHYNYWDDPIPHPEVGTIFLVRESETPSPANLTAQLNPMSIQLNWSAPANIPSGSSLQGYNLYYALNNGAFTLLDYVQTTYYTHSGYFQAGLHGYHVTAVYNNGESDPSNEVTVQTTAIAPDGDFEADKLMPYTTDLVEFTDLSVYDPTGWTWEFVPSTVEYEAGTGHFSQHPVVRFTEPGIYTVQLTVENIAGSDTEVKYGYITVSDGISVGVQTTANDPVIQVFPNPATDILNIKSDQQIDLLRLYNGSGQQVKVLRINKNSYRYDVTSLNSGIYILTLETETGYETRRIVIQ